MAGRSRGEWAGRVLVTFCFLVWLLVTEARAVCDHSSSCARAPFICSLHCNKIYVKTTVWGFAQEKVGALNNICLKK